MGGSSGERVRREYHETTARRIRDLSSSAANPGGAGLGLVVYEQLSVHNLTLTEKATGRTAAAASGVFGFTEWSGPA